eukprot:12393443-Alexandrium_andersonii.AAC.1
MTVLITKDALSTNACHVGEEQAALLAEIAAGRGRQAMLHINCSHHQAALVTRPPTLALGE